MILLINPAPPANSPWYLGQKVPPLGLAYIAAALEKVGFKVEIVDNYLFEKPMDYLKKTVEKLNPQMIGVTCSSVTYQGCIETARAIKEVRPFCKVVVGGPHPSYMPESMLQHPEIDYVVLGEGERSIVELATYITKCEDESTLATIPGIAYRHEERIVKNPQKFIDDLDQIPYPARHLLPMHLYNRMVEYLDIKPADLMNVVRGCPHNCAFCEIRKLWGQTCRAFSPSRVVEEINYMINEYGSKGIYFIGDNFPIQKRHTINICELIKKQKLDVEWACDARVDLVSRDLLRVMKDAGCRTIWFGVESGSRRILEKINKGITLEQALRAFKLCKEEGIQIACSFILGVPGETIDDMKSTFKFVTKLDPDWCRFNIFIGVPGSSLYEEVLQNGLYDRLEDFVAYVKTEDFDFNLITKIQRQFRKEFNRSPKRVFRRIKREGFLNFLKRNFRVFPSNNNPAS